MKSLLERLQPLKTAIHYIRVVRIGSVRLVYLAPYSHDYNWVSRRTPHVVL